MSGKIWDYLLISFVIPIHLATSSLGVVTNVLNMVITTRLGLKSSMNVEIFSLALTDCLVTFMELLMYCCILLSYVIPDSDVDFGSIGFTTLVPDPAYFISDWITTLISVERCLSVVLPFKVKQIFNRTRSVVVIVGIYVIFIGFAAPLYAAQYVSWDVKPWTDGNGTTGERKVLTAHFTDDSEVISVVIDTTCTISLTSVSQTILISSTAAMIYSLKTSSKVRRSDQKDLSNVSTLSPKERRLVKLAISLAVILTICYFPRYITIIAYYAFPDLFEERGGQTLKTRDTFTASAQKINIGLNPSPPMGQLAA